MGTKQKTYIGGQAVIEGVLMRNKEKIAIAVRNPNKKIVVKHETIHSITESFKPFSWPFVRGIFNLFEMMLVGIKAITFSTNESLGEEEEKVTNVELFITITVSLGLSFLLFYFLPLWLTNLIAGLPWMVFNLVDGLIRITLVLLYIWGIGNLKDIRRVFQYHGAEHKAVNCYESGLPLTPENAHKFTTIHPRCGTSFIFVVLVISIIVFSFVKVDTFLMRLLSRFLLLPVIAGISYEFLRYSADHYDNPLVKMLVAPGLAMQSLTTRKPNKKQLEVAIRALKEVL